jgi:hypothetical protein
MIVRRLQIVDVLLLNIVLAVPDDILDLLCLLEGFDQCW